ncbi:MAG: cytochrome C oxidase subunit IV family protein [bacterium]
MAADGDSHPSYFLVWMYLVILVLVSVACAYLIPGAAGQAAIFLLAGAKAVLVGFYFMHLRAERILIHSLALVPLLVVLILFLGLIPDIVYGK